MYIQLVVCENCKKKNIVDDYARSTFCRRCNHGLVDKSDKATMRELKKFPESGQVHFVEFKRVYVIDEYILDYIKDKEKIDKSYYEKLCR